MNSVTPPRAGRREWIGLAVLSLPAMLLVMDLTVLHLAVPHLSADLQPSSAQLLWITDVYGFLIAGFLITMGNLGDRIGRRKLLLIGAAAFAVASVLAAYSTSPEMLIATRAVLGIAGATLMPSTLSLIRNMFHDPRQRSVAISVWMMSFLVGGSIGPLVGGAMLENFWWGSVFLLGLPVMALLLVLGPFLLPEYKDPGPSRLDLTSAVLLLAAVLPMIYGLKQIAQDGFAWPPAGAILVGLAVGVTFVRRQRALPDPLIDVRLFGNPAFSASLAAMMVGSFVMMGLNLFVMQYLQLVHGMSPFQAGLWALPATAAGMVTMMVAPVLARVVRPGFVIGGGLALSAVGVVIMTQADPGSGIAAVITGSAVLFAGAAPSGSLGTDLIVGAAPPERAGAASAVSETGNEFAGAMGLAILGSIGTAVYRGEMKDTIPAGTPPETTNAALDTLAGATSAATRLPGRLGGELMTAGREAFTQGMQLTAAVSGAVLLVAAVLAAVLLRNVYPLSEPAEESEPASELQVTS